MIAQEYIPGPPSNCYLIDGFIDRNGQVQGTFARRRRRMYPLDFGNSSAVSSVARNEVADAEEVLLDLLRTIGYRGIFNAEFKRDDRDGGFRFFEINVRTWLYAEFASRCGFDAVIMAYRDALGLPIEWSGEYAVGRTIIYPYFDLAACMQMRRQGELSLGDIARSWLGSEQLVYTADDPRPFLLGTAELWKGFIRRRLPGG